MNSYLADRIAHDHVDTLIADAAQIRRARQARAARPVSGPHTRAPQPARRSGRRFSRPIAAFHAWLAAGQL